MCVSKVNGRISPLSTFTGQEVHPLRSQGKHLQRQVHATHQRPGDRLVLRRRHHLLHPHGEEPRAEQAVSVHVPLRNSLRGVRQGTKIWPTNVVHLRCLTNFPLNETALPLVSSDYDRTKRPLHLPIMWGRWNGAMVRPPHQDQLHKGRLQGCTISTVFVFI